MDHRAGQCAHGHRVNPDDPVATVEQHGDEVLTVHPIEVRPRDLSRNDGRRDLLLGCPEPGLPDQFDTVDRHSVTLRHGLLLLMQ